MLPIRSEDMPAVLEKLSQSNASACLRTGVRGGGGALAVTPAPVPGGGWGSADFLFCRSNGPGSEIVVTESAMSIKHGTAIADAIKERLDTIEAAVGLLIQKAAESAKGATAWPTF